MLLSDIIKELEAKGHTDIKMVSNRFGQLSVNSTIYSKNECDFEVHSWSIFNGKLNNLGFAFYDMDENSTF